MIIVKILGGLGNQMFQYAAAKSLAEKNVTELKADVSGFKDHSLRDFDLSKLRIDLPIASDKEIKKLKATNSIQRIKERLTPYYFKRFYKEPFFHHDANFLKLRDDVYIQGYFQSQKYLSGREEKIRSEFIFKEDVSTQVKTLAIQMQSEESVAIHLRKGDYTNPAIVNVHGVLETSYYKKGISFIESVFPNLKLYLFSDDPEMAKQELHLDSLTTVSGAITQNHYEDFHLMSHCRHNIIANSSFSWWAAWLNSNPNKIVIAPKAWFNNGPKDTQDLIPESWIRL